MLRFVFSLALVALAVPGIVHAQAPGVPRLIPASGTLLDQSGKPLNGNNVKITFSVYAGADDQEPLWSETLRVQVAAGRYDTLIGSSSPDGIPSSVFGAGEPRWLGLTADKAVAPPRALIVSVPYALSADDASKLGGYPASAFVLKDDPAAPKSAGSPSGWKQAVDEEAATRLQSDTSLQNNIDDEAAARVASDNSLQSSLDGATSELHGKIDAAKGELSSKIDATRSELDHTIAGTKGELNAKIDASKSELNQKITDTEGRLNGKIAFETTKVTTEQEAKLLALKNELQSDSSQKVTELDQKKTSKEEFEQEKTKKQLELEDLKGKKLEKEEFLFEKQKKDLDIEDLKQKKLDKLEYLAEKLAKEAAILDLREKKLEKIEFEAEKLAKNAVLKDLDDRIKELKGKSDSLSEFVVSFAREADGDTAGASVCIGSHVAVGIAVGLAGDPLESAAPQCAQVTGVGMRADGILIGMLSGIVAMPGLQQIPPASELACAAGHVVAGLNVEGGNLYAACRRLFGNDPLVNSEGSVAVGAGQASQACAVGQSAIGFRKVSGLLEIVCR